MAKGAGAAASAGGAVRRAIERKLRDALRPAVLEVVRCPTPASRPRFSRTFLLRRRGTLIRLLEEADACGGAGARGRRTSRTCTRGTRVIQGGGRTRRRTFGYALCRRSSQAAVRYRGTDLYTSS